MIRADDFAAELASAGRVTVDTSLCVYQLGPDSSRKPLAGRVLKMAADGDLEVDIPGVVQLELLTKPLERRDTHSLAQVRRFLYAQRGVAVSVIGVSVIEVSAEVRAAVGLKLPDALVVGSAIEAGSRAIVGNDTRFGRLNGITDIESLLTRRRIRVPRYIHIDNYLEETDAKDAE